MAGKRFLDILETETKRDWACFLETIGDEYKNVQLITFVMDNPKTHSPGAIYETYPPEKAKALWDRFVFVYTPSMVDGKTMEEIELNDLTGQCLNRQFDNIFDVKKVTLTWQNVRNTKIAKTNW
jgi:hypothetical protein